MESQSILSTSSLSSMTVSQEAFRLSEERTIWRTFQELKKSCYSEHECPCNLIFLLNLWMDIMNTCWGCWWAGDASGLRVLLSIDLRTIKVSGAPGNWIFLWWRCAESWTIVIPPRVSGTFIKASGAKSNQTQRI